MLCDLSLILVLDCVALDSCGKATSFGEVFWVPVHRVSRRHGDGDLPAMGGVRSDDAY